VPDCAGRSQWLTGADGQQSKRCRSRYVAASIKLNGTGTQITPTITWTTPTAITYGTPLSRRQLNATSSVAGTFRYSPATGTVLTAGQQTLTATFTTNRYHRLHDSHSDGNAYGEPGAPISSGHAESLPYGTLLSANSTERQLDRQLKLHLFTGGRDGTECGHETLTATFTQPIPPTHRQLRQASR